MTKAYWQISTDMLFTDCSSPGIQFAVRGGLLVYSGVSLRVGDVLSCSAENALSYRWTNVLYSNYTKIYGKTLSISRPGRFNYECTVFMDCGSGAFCPFTGGISGYARGRIYGFTLFYSRHFICNLLNLSNTFITSS